MTSLVNFTLEECYNRKNKLELLNIMMSPDNLAMLGYSEGIENGQSSISRAEVNQILSGITNDMQRQTCNYALSKVGYPYSQAYRDSGDFQEVTIEQERKERGR